MAEAKESTVVGDAIHSRVIELESQLNECENKAAQFQQEIKTQVAVADAKVLKLENELRVQRFENQELKNQMNEMGDYEEIKRELDIFRSLEFDAETDENVPLERILMEKNKKLENDFTVAKMELLELKNIFDQNVEKIHSLTAQLTEKSGLIVKLESDIHRLNFLQQKSIQPNEHLESLITEKKTADHSIVPILTSQRDRYKQRFEEAHRNVLELTSKVTNLQDEVNRLQSDNVGLYEKLRYTESFSSSSRQVKCFNQAYCRYGFNSSEI
jgi:homeobox protein cut-like